MKKIIVFISTSVLTISILSCSTTTTSIQKVEAEMEPVVAMVETEVKIEAAAIIVAEKVPILGSWYGRMILGEKDKKGNWEYRGFERYHFYDNNTLDYSIKVEQYGIVTSDYSHTYEWKYENEKYYKRLRNSKIKDWTLFDVECLNENNIVIDGVKLKRI